MSLQLHVGHSGHSLAVDTTRITTLDALRTFIATHADIQPNRQVLLTIKGKSVRPQTLLTEDELYVFDSSLLSPSSASTADLSRHAVYVNFPEPLDAGDPPDTIASQTDLQSWQALFHNRLSWARRQRDQCAGLSDLAQRSLVEQEVIRRGLGVALDSLRLHIKGAEQKQTAAASWADELLADQERRMDTWEKDSRLLKSIPARAEFAPFVQYRHGQSQNGREVSLETILPFEQIQDAAAQAAKAMEQFKRRVAGMRATLAEAKQQSEELVAAAEQLHVASSLEDSLEPDKLMDEIDILLRKITSDDTHVGSLQRTAQAVSQASKMALLHTRNYLPNLLEYTGEMNDLVRKTVEQRNNTAETCMQHMQMLSRIESQLSKVLAEVKSLDVSQEDQQAFNTLNITTRLPYVYGSLLIEATRRREWAEKMRKDSSTLAEEMATYQEEETRRRQRWLNTIDDVIQPELVKSKAFGIEVNLQADTEQWPDVSREEIEDYISSLIKTAVPEEVTRELSLALRNLDQPTKKQVKHAKAFRAGSIHEAAFGSASLALRGDDEHKVLRDANLKLEEELRGQKSRVRKLEDLLHRQTAVSRVASGDVFTPQLDLVSRGDSPSPSPSPGVRRISEDFRPTSARSRRPSSNQGIEEKRLARRIVTLEADLQSQRDANAVLEREAAERREAHESRRLKIVEAESIKKDIMSNMEAQGREFATERRGLEQELANTRSRVEELEDELDRILGSRDQERGGIDARSRALEGEIAKARHETENARRDLAAEQDRTSTMEEQIRSLKSAKQELESNVRTMQAKLDQQQVDEQNHIELLSAAHAHLDPATNVPPKYTTLVSALEDLARRSASHVKDLAEAVAMVKAENESLISQQKSQTAELTEVRERRDGLETEVARVKDQGATASARADSLASQLEDEREQLRLLRSKFAEGETGAGALRHRVEEQEAQVGKLSEQLAESRSHVNSLDVELMRVQSKLNHAESAAKSTSVRMDLRSARAKDMTRRVFAQNARLMRLLETLGFAVSYKDSQMVIERASKVAGASTTLTEPSQILSRTTSLTSPPTLSTIRKASDPTSDSDPSLSFLHWADLPSQPAEDAAYEQLLTNLSLFSTDTFADAIAKRLRDFEYTARKFRLESRNAAAKATRSAHEASQKLAVRDFKEGDLALFLPTKGKAVGAWAAFNINAPHHFLREKESMSLGKREWLVARITKVEERVVDLSRSMRSTRAEDGGDRRSLRSEPEVSSSAVTDKDSSQQLDNDNPFDLSDGLTWYLVHATEERGGAPTTPGAGKVTVQASAANANAERALPIRRMPDTEGEAQGVRDLKEKLGRSLSSRRSSSTSKRSVAAGSVKGVPIPIVPGQGKSSSSPLLPTSEDASSSSPVVQSAGAGTSLLSVGLGPIGARNASSPPAQLDVNKGLEQSTAAITPGKTRSQGQKAETPNGSAAKAGGSSGRRRQEGGHVSTPVKGTPRKRDEGQEGRRSDDPWTADGGEGGRWKRLWSLDLGVEDIRGE